LIRLAWIRGCCEPTCGIRPSSGESEITYDPGRSLGVFLADREFRRIRGSEAGFRSAGIIDEKK